MKNHERTENQRNGADIPRHLAVLTVFKRLTMRWCAVFPAMTSLAFSSSVISACGRLGLGDFTAACTWAAWSWGELGPLLRLLRLGGGQSVQPLLSGAKN